MIEIPDPDRVLIAAVLDRTDLEKLTYDDEIYQCVQTREDGIQKVPIRLEPTEGAASKFIMERCFGVQIRRTIIRGAYKALLYGWSVQEIVWDKEVYDKENIFVPKDISDRSLRYFSVLPDGTLVQNVVQDGVTGERVIRIPKLQEKIENIPGAGYSWVVMDTKCKFLLTRSRSSWDNPYGEALLSRLYWAWFFRNTSWRFLGQYLERYAIPILLGITPEDASGVTTEELAQVLTRAQQDSVVAMRGGTLTSLAANSAGNDLYKNVEDMLVRRIEKVILGQTLTSGTDGGSGNRALGDVHNEVRKDKVESDIGLIQPTVQTYIDACFYLNGFSGKPPEVIFGDEVNLATARAERDRILIESGMVGGFSEDYLMDNYGFRPGELKLVEEEPAPPRTEVIEVDEKEESESKELKAVAGSFGFAGDGSKGLPSEYLLETLALWGGMKAGSPFVAKKIRAAILKSESAGELVSNLEGIQEDINMKFADTLFQVNETAVNRGIKDVKAGN
jgi:hypothetical protein